jgi:hypothetical protein
MSTSKKEFNSDRCMVIMVEVSMKSYSISPDFLSALYLSGRAFVQFLTVRIDIFASNANSDVFACEYSKNYVFD